MTGIRAAGVTVEVDGRRVVDGVDLDVPAGAWTAVIGPNGAGKTTLLRAVAGLVGCTGAVSVGGVDPGAVSRRQLARVVAVVPQRPTVPPGMSVTDYVLLGRSPYIPYLGIESPADVAVAGAVLGRLGLTGLEKRELSSLSGGELQRALLARALAQQAPVLVLDEPTTALDVGHQQQVLELVDHLRREQRLTVLTAMHDLTVAGQVADELVLLAAGRVVAAGVPSAVLTEATVTRHYGVRVRVLAHPDGGVVVVPSRPGRPPEAAATDGDTALAGR